MFILIILVYLVYLCLLGFTWDHLGSPGFIWVHLGSLGFTWVHLGSLGFTWLHLVDLGDVRDLLSENEGQFWEGGFGGVYSDISYVLRSYGPNETRPSGKNPAYGRPLSPLEVCG